MYKKYNKYYQKNNNQVILERDSKEFPEEVELKNKKALFNHENYYTKQTQNTIKVKGLIIVTSPHTKNIQLKKKTEEDLSFQNKTMTNFKKQCIFIINS